MNKVACVECGQTERRGEWLGGKGILLMNNSWNYKYRLQFIEQGIFSNTMRWLQIESCLFIVVIWKEDLPEDSWTFPVCFCKLPSEKTRGPLFCWKIRQVRDRDGRLLLYMPEQIRTPWRYKFPSFASHCNPYWRTGSCLQQREKRNMAQTHANARHGRERNESPESLQCTFWRR